MSGHSKWSSIKRKKKTNDDKRGRLFSKLANDIRVSLKNGSDIKHNFKFKNAVSRALDNNINKSIINKIISEKEIYGKNKILFSATSIQGSIFILECVEDNKNKIISDLKYLFAQFSGSLVSLSNVEPLFKRCMKIKLFDFYNEEYILFNLSYCFIFNFLNDSFCVHIDDISKISSKLKLMNYNFNYSFEFISEKDIFLDTCYLNKLIVLKKKIKEKPYIFNVFTNIAGL